MESWILGKVEDYNKYKTFGCIIRYWIPGSGNVWEARNGTRWYGMRLGVVDIRTWSEKVSL